VRRLVFIAFAVVLAAAPALARRHPPRPTPTPAPTPLPLEARVELLRAQISEIGRIAPGRLGVALVDTSHGARVSLRGAEEFPLASTCKLAVALVAFRRVDQHRLDLDKRVVVKAADLRAGSEIAASHPRGGVSLTYWELVRAMLVDGDDTASDLVLRTLGGPRAVQSVLDRLGIAGFRIRKSEAQLAAGARRGRAFAGGGDNAGSPEGVAALLVGIAAHRLLLEDSTDEMLAMLAASGGGAARLRAGLPDGVTFAHLSGASRVSGGVAGATNDAGIVTLPDGRRIVIVAFLAESNADGAARDAILARVASAAYDAFAP